MRRLHCIRQPARLAILAIAATLMPQLCPAAGRRAAVGDVLRITATDLEGPGVETVIRATISDKGTINLPYAGDVRVIGQTTKEIEATLLKAYADFDLAPVTWSVSFAAKER